MRDLILTRRRLLFTAGPGVLGVALLHTMTGCSTATNSTAPATGANPTSAPTSTGATHTGTVVGDWRRVDLSFVSAYLLIRNAEAAVVDLGTTGSASRIDATLQAAGSGWNAVRHIILTHRHPDHVGGLAEVAKQVGATIYAGEADIAGITSPTPVRPARENDDIFGLRIIATPGHTAGHVAVFDPSTGVLVAGDALRTAGGEPIGPDPQYSANMTQAAASVRKLASLNVTAILPGHGEPLTAGAADALHRLADSLPTG